MLILEHHIASSHHKMRCVSCAVLLVSSATHPLPLCHALRGVISSFAFVFVSCKSSAPTPRLLLPSALACLLCVCAASVPEGAACLPRIPAAASHPAMLTLLSPNQSFAPTSFALTCDSSSSLGSPSWGRGGNCRCVGVALYDLWRHVFVCTAVQEATHL